ncbi:MAG: 16S rRNA (cytosine(1402)-N(4))-methyltransferase RsmH [Dehalococcoidia bacterium]|jgi:16S rRNA (cytosine1402-N4)-methyltransferase
MSAAIEHIPVLLEETLEALDIRPGGRYIDCTVGPGGHAAAILEESAPGGQLLGIDADPGAIKMARARLDAYGSSVLLVNRNFVNLKSICLKHGFLPVHGILLDLGLSSVQLERNGRGFSFRHDSQLDMRFSPRQEVTADNIVNTASESELSDIIYEYGEERFSRRIARQIVRQRPINSSLELAQTVERAVGGRRGRIHPATRTFQALRIAVNRELENLKTVLEQAVDVLGFGGRLAVISYHSLEDRIVKQFMQRQAVGEEPCLKLINKKVITPSLAEIQYNPSSRSAKLRAAERISMPKENNSG